MIIKIILLAVVIVTILSVCLDGYNIYSIDKSSPCWKKVQTSYSISMSVRLIIILTIFYLLNKI